MSKLEDLEFDLQQLRDEFETKTAELERKINSISIRQEEDMLYEVPKLIDEHLEQKRKK